MPCFGLKGLSANCSATVSAAIYNSAADKDLLQCRECGCCHLARVYKQAVRIELTDDEMAYAEAIGKIRNESAKRLELPDKHGFTGQGDDIHVLGARAELAFARFCDVPWSASNLTFKAPDVGCVQVRGRSLLGYDLIVRSDDSNTQPFVLVVGSNPFYIMGWTTGALARKERSQTYGGREAAHFVRSSKLFRPQALIPIACDPLIVSVAVNGNEVVGRDKSNTVRYAGKTI